MKKLISVFVSAVFMTSLLLTLTSCGDDRQKLYILSYGDYIGTGVIDEFEKAYPQYRVIYDDTAETPEAMYQKLKSGVPYDVLVCSDYIVEKMINENLLNELDKSKLKNYQYISEDLRGGLYDPEGKYTVPYMWGTVGIIYNKKLVSDNVDSWNLLWNTKYKGQIQILDSVRDSMGMALKYSGFSINSTNESEINKARDALIAQKSTMDPVVGVDSIKQAMVAGQYAFTVTYSGDALMMIEQNPDLAYVVPKEGSNVWVDAMIMPNTGKNNEGAYAYIDFMCSTDIATKNVEYIKYSTPHTQALANVSDELRNNPAFNPSADVIARCEYYDDLGSAIDLYNAAWEAFRMA